jgi:hypothetical protein
MDKILFTVQNYCFYLKQMILVDMNLKKVVISKI